MLILNKDKSFIVDNTYVKYFIKDNSKILITFAGAGNPIKIKDVNISSSYFNQEDNGVSPWGFDFAKKNDLNIISFHSLGENSWYRSEELYNFIKLLSLELDIFSERLGYGGSMGGFGISSFANLLKIDRILLLNPVSTLNIELAPFHTRPSNNGKQLNWNNKGFDGADMYASGYIVYDPLHSIDRKHAERYKTLIKLKVPGVGHGMAMYLKSMGILNWLFKDFITDTINISFFNEESRKRRLLPRYYQHMMRENNKRLTPKRKEIILKYKKINIKEVIKPKVNINITSSEINTIRDIALSIEKTNLEQAYILMMLARRLRPNGKFILKKVKEYSKKLNIE